MKNLHLSHKIGLLFIFCLLVSCGREERNLFDKTPNQRIQESVEELRSELADAPEGWEITYFSALDSTIFNDIRRNIYESPFAWNYIESEFGRGGQSFLARFKPDGTMVMNILSDKGYNNNQSSRYGIRFNTIAQLSFISQNYIHELYKSDFLFYKKDEKGNLIFRTNNYLEKNREYVRFRKLENTPGVWEKNISKVKENAVRLQEAQKIVIKNQEGNIMFESSGAKRDTDKRYILFYLNHDPDNYFSTYFSGIGSGYAILPDRIEFLPGLRYNEHTVFTSFKKEGSRLVSQSNGYTAEILK